MTILRQYVAIAAEAQAETLLGALKALATALEVLDDCEGVDLLRDVDRPERFVFVERWTTVAAHKAAAAGLPKHLIGPVLAALASPLEGSYLAVA